MRRWTVPLAAIIVNVFAWWLLAAPSFPLTRTFFARHPMLPFWAGGILLSINGILIVHEQFKGTALGSELRALKATQDVAATSLHGQTQLLAAGIPVTLPEQQWAAWRTIGVTTLNELVTLWRTTYHDGSRVVNIRATLYQPRLIELVPVAWSSTAELPSTIWAKQRGLVGWSYARREYYFLADVEKREQLERNAGRRFLFERRGKDAIAAILSLPIIDVDRDHLYGFLTIDSNTALAAEFDDKRHPLHPPAVIERATPALALLLTALANR